VTASINNPPTLRLYVLDTGVIQCGDYAIYSPSAPANSYREMSVRSYLIVHPAGALLWDTGISDATAAKPAGERLNDTHTFRVPKTLSSQLMAVGYEPSDISQVGMSHMHIDHVGNLDLFPHATVLMQQAEHDDIYGPDAEQLGYMPDTYAALDRDRVQTVTGESDVFGDGTVRMIPLPGHTNGHQGLLVELPRTGRVLLAGDISYSTVDYAIEAVRDLNLNIDASRESIRKAKALEAAGTTVWLQHDMEAQRDIPTAPHHYE